jgi:hypothetical protein
MTVLISAFQRTRIHCHSPNSQFFNNLKIDHLNFLKSDKKILKWLYIGQYRSNGHDFYTIRTALISSFQRLQIHCHSATATRTVGHPNHSIFSKKNLKIKNYSNSHNSADTTPIPTKLAPFEPP